MARSLIIALALLVAISAVAARIVGQPNFHGNWVREGRTDPDKNVRVTIALTQRDPQAIKDTCGAVSDPLDARYGQYLSLDEIRNMVAPSPRAQRTVLQWLRSSGVSNFKFAHTRDFVTAVMPVRTAEAMFGAEMHEFRHQTLRHVVVSQSVVPIRVDDEIAQHIDFVGGITKLPFSVPRLFTKNEPSNTDPNVTPAYLRQYYGADDLLNTSPENQQSIFACIGQYFSQDDLDSFGESYSLPLHKIARTIGPDPSPAGAEADLDVEYVLGTGQNVTTWFWSIEQSSADPFLDWAVAVNDQPNVPYLHSVSYGGDERGFTSDEATRINNELAKMCTRGLTVVVASGDDGVGGSGVRQSTQDCSPFHPTLPAAFPYVTSVGATQYKSDTEEEACSSKTGGVITTGGGFSTLFDMPSWQKTAVEHYLSTGPNIPPSSYFNAKGRAYPDISLNGHNYEIVIKGQTEQVHGTSCSTPAFGGFVSLLNDLRMRAGKAPLGFLNPLLYQLYAEHPEAFNEVTTGENNCAAAGWGEPNCCQYGFSCAKGWDGATGLGTPKIDQFVKLVV